MGEVWATSENNAFTVRSGVWRVDVRLSFTKEGCLENSGGSALASNGILLMTLSFGALNEMVNILEHEQPNTGTEYMYGEIGINF